MKKLSTPLLLVIIALLTGTFSAFAQDTPAFLSVTDSGDIMSPPTPVRRAEAIASEAPRVRVAYIIPANRTEQPRAVEDLQHTILLGQQWFRQQMEQNGFGEKTFLYETEEDGTTPLIHVVHVEETDDFLRIDPWGNTNEAARKAGVSIWTPGEVWVLIPEIHRMLPDGSIEGDVALGASWGTGDSPGVVVAGSAGLPFHQPSMITDDRPYQGMILPALGPYPMQQNITFPWFEGNTLSSRASTVIGAFFHELGHAFGLPHDYRNDTNFHGNLIYNGLRGFRGSLFPERYPQDHTRLAYASSLILDVSHYFNRHQRVTPGPDVSAPSSGSVVPEQGLISLPFRASDSDSLSFAHLRYEGNVVAEVLLSGTRADTSFRTPYYGAGDNNRYTVAVYDQQGNVSSRDVSFFVPAGHNRAPRPYVRIEPPVPQEDQPVVLDASRSSDESAPAALRAEWDTNNDGHFDTEVHPANQTLPYSFESSGNYLVRLRVTDLAGAQSVSTPVSVKIPGKPAAMIASLRLINASADEVITELEGGEVVNLADEDYASLSVQAHPSPEKVDSVQFVLDGPTSHRQTERITPYALFGDTPQGNFTGRSLRPGSYTLTVTPYVAGSVGSALTLSFEAVEDFTSVPPTLAWDRTLGGNSFDDLQTLLPAPDGGYLLAGISWSDASGDKSEDTQGVDYWVVKVDAQGNRVWDRSIGGTFAEYLSDGVATDNGRYTLTGYSDSPTSGDKSENVKGGEDYWTIQIDAQGERVWDKTLGGSRTDHANSIVATADGGYLLAGYSDSPASGDKSEDSRGGRDYWIVKTDAHGRKIWDKTFGGAEDDRLNKVVATPDGGYLLLGISNSNASGDKSDDSQGQYDYWVVKINGHGRKMWDYTLGGAGYDQLSDAALTPDGGYLLVGSSNSDKSGDKSEDSNSDVAYKFDSWVVKIDAHGRKIWDKTLGGTSYDATFTVVPTLDGNYLLGGFSDSPASVNKSEDSRGRYDYWLVEIDAHGTKIWDRTIGGAGSDLLRTILATRSGGYLLGGASTSSISGDKSEDSRGEEDYWVVKLDDPNASSVSALTLVNTTNQQDLLALQDGDTLDLTQLGVRQLSLQATTSPEQVDSLLFALDGPLTHQQTERIQPYALFGDTPRGTLTGQYWLPGSYSLSVTPYARGQQGVTRTLSFTVIDGPRLRELTLVDATRDQTLGPLADGDTLDLATLGNRKLSVQVTTQPGRVTKVTFALQGPIVYTNTEYYRPYALFGDEASQNGPDYVGLRWNTGHYTLQVIAYQNSLAGATQTVRFTVIDSRGHSTLTTAAQLWVYPVPTSGQVSLRYEGMAEGSVLMLLNQQGTLLLQRPLSHPSETLDLTTFGPGFYYLQVLSDKRTFTRRLVVE